MKKFDNIEQIQKQKYKKYFTKNHPRGVVQSKLTKERKKLASR